MSFMTSEEIRAKFLEFFKEKGHAIIPSASLVPENDPSSLFTTAGMQPLVPYLLGHKHPAGMRIADVQKCIRTGDIDDVGDNRHLTFFEMLGNWSLGDYFKREAIEWSFEFLTDKEKGLGLDKNRIYVTVFKGEHGIPRDEESTKIWQEVFAKAGMKADVAADDEEIFDNIRIIPLGVKDNFWIAGATGPCGGDTEMFYDTRPEKGKLGGKFSEHIDSFRLIEVWNDVFMEFNKTHDSKYLPLTKKNVDTGMGLERTTAVVNGKDNVFDTDVFQGILAQAKQVASDERAQRIIADHIRSAVFMIADGIVPSNTDRGYVLRRLIRRAVMKSTARNIDAGNVSALVDSVADKFGTFQDYKNLVTERATIKQVIQEEIEKFTKTLSQGLKEFEKLAKDNISGKEAFTLFSSFGFPLEVTLELAKEKGITVDVSAFNTELKKHQDLSRSGSEKKFKGGLADTGEMSVKYHTATHLLNAALRQVLGDTVSQKGSNITPERLRFDFSHHEKMTEDQKKQVENLVNIWIKEDLPVSFTEMPKAEAEKVAIHAFHEKYGDTVKVYSIGRQGNYISREFCGGPHVAETGILGHFKIQKEEAVSAGVRRIKATLE
jgi:alanyl-tRNA synthetase